jgi:urate oxidase
LENLDKIEAQLERVTTVADKLDATLKNLNVTLDKTDSIFKSSTDAVANLIIATDQVNTNIGVINKAAKLTNGAVERS